MPNRSIRLIFSVAVILAFSPSVVAQEVNQSDGRKNQSTFERNFSGVWRQPGLRSLNLIPEERGKGFAFTVEPPPMQPWAAEKFRANRDPASEPNYVGRIDRNPGLHCFPPGPTWLHTQQRPFELLQVSDRILIVYEWDHWMRQIWMDGRGHPENLDPTWMGHSIGKWDEDTLVVDTVGLNDKTWLDMAGHVHSEALHIVERFWRKDHDTLEVDVTFDDPVAYTKTWTGRRIFELHPNWEIQEHIACEDHLLHEHAIP